MQDACVARSDLAEDSAFLCGAGRSLLNLAEQGTLYPCSLLRIPAGNIRDQPLRELWRTSPQLIQLRGFTKANIPQCLGCEHRPYCIPCIGTNFDHPGGLFEPAPQSCMRARTCHALANEHSAR
jgi:radical SAM protein with 4Fe4S-binding SPASM domain